jgi:hypothetical protein
MAIQLSSAKISQAHVLNHVVKDHFSPARMFSFRLSKSNSYRLLLQPNHNILYQFFIFDTRSCVSRSAVACGRAKYIRRKFRVNAVGRISSKKISTPTHELSFRPSIAPCWSSQQSNDSHNDRA